MAFLVQSLQRSSPSIIRILMDACMASYSPLEVTITDGSCPEPLSLAR